MRNNEEHGRLKDLLTDTITLLCKNGLSYSQEFSVDALIGITLDRQEVVLVSIKEIIKTVEERESSVDDQDIADSDNTPVTQKQKKRRKRKRSKDEIKRQSGVESDDCFTEFYAESVPKSSTQNISTTSNVSVKQEKLDNDDCILVKNESNKETSTTLTENENRPVENSSTLPVPVFSPTQAGNTTNDSSTVEETSSSTLQPGVQPLISADYYQTTRIPNSPYLRCTICAKLLKGKQGMQRHLQGAHKIGPSYKCNCGSVFTWEWSFKQHKKKCKACETSSGILKGDSGADPCNMDSMSQENLSLENAGHVQNMAQNLGLENAGHVHNIAQVTATGSSQSDIQTFTTSQMSGLFWPQAGSYEPSNVQESQMINENVITSGINSSGNYIAIIPDT